MTPTLNLNLIPPTAEQHARRLAGAMGASVGTSPDGTVLAWLAEGWLWRATGTQVMAIDGWGLMVTMMGRGAEKRGVKS